jgi:hypothetical protein
MVAMCTDCTAARDTTPRWVVATYAVLFAAIFAALMWVIAVA